MRLWSHILKFLGLLRSSRRRTLERLQRQSSPHFTKSDS